MQTLIMMADVAPPPASQPLILDLNEPHMSMDEIVERRFSTPPRIEGPPSEDMLGAEGAFPNVRKAYWRSASWTSARGPRSLLQRTTSGKAMARTNGRGLVDQESNMGKGKGLRIQVDNGWKGDVEVFKLGDEKGSTVGGPEKLNRLPRGIPAMHLDLGALQMDSQNIEPTEIQARRTKFAYFEKHCSRVAEHVYLGSDVVARNREILKESGITHVLNCVGFVCPEYFVGELVYKTLWLQDIPGEDLMSILYDIFDYLEEVRLQHGRVLVHCCQGVSRSTSLVIAYLMWRDNRSFDETFRDVKAVRGTANPNMGFACQLLQWQKRITWGPEGEPPTHTGRLYRVAPQSPFSPLYLVPKPVGKLRASELDRRGVFVVDAPNGEVFVWVGEEAQPSMAEAGGRIAAQLLRYERAKGPVTVVQQGQEGPVFWQVLSAGGGDEAFEERWQQRTAAAEAQELEKQRRERPGGHPERASSEATNSDSRSAGQGSDADSPANVGTLSAYDADYDLFRRASKGEIKPATPGCSALPGPVKSTSVPASPKKATIDIQKQVSHSAASTPRSGPVSKPGFEADPESVPQPGASSEPRPAPSLNRKQSQPDVYVPSVSRSYPVSTLPPPSPSLPPPNKRSKSPTTTEQNADVLSPPPQSPTSSMGSFYKQHRVLSPRPGIELTEAKPRKSPSILGPGGERRLSLSEKMSLKLPGGELGGRLSKEKSSESPRQPWPPVLESHSGQPSFPESWSFGSPEAWAVPESPRVSRRTSFPGFSAGGNQGEKAKTPTTRMGRPSGHQLPEDAERKSEGRPPADAGSEGERSRETTPSEGSNVSELVRTSSSDGSGSTEADEWSAREPGSKVAGAEADKPEVAVPASPVGPLPGSGILSPGLSEEAESLVDERRSPTPKHAELLLERRDLVEVRGFPMDVDRRKSLARGSTELHSSGGPEKVDDEPGPRLFEAPHFGEVQMFDTDDLHSESAYVLLVDADGSSVSDGGKRHELYVWLGSGCPRHNEDRRMSVGSMMSTDSGNGDVDGSGLGREFLRRRGLPLDSPVVVVDEGKEPDEFWSHFVNG